MSKFIPTAEQSALLAFVKSTKKNLAMKAGAGCGKTTVSLWLLGQLSGRKAMVAFSRDIKGDIEEKVNELGIQVEVLTMNALGYRALMKVYGRGLKVDADNLFTLFKAKFGERLVRDRYAFFANVRQLIDLAKGALASTPAELADLAIDYDLGLNGDTEEAITIALTIMGEQKANKKLTSIDFNDQMWLPVVQGLAFPQFDVLCIDEAQDTNALQLEMLSRCVAKGGRVIAVGDDRQAIFRFRGADSSAFNNIIARFDMTVLPLMTTFRCGKAIVREAQTLVPDFKAGENNHEGTVRSIMINKLVEQIEPGDFVISRTNAPNVAACMRALAAGIPAAVVGRDVGGALKKLVLKMRASNVAELETRLEAWLQKEIEKLSAKIPVKTAAIEAAQDKVDTIFAIADGAESVDEVISRIERLFVQNTDARRVDFTSTHKAKGRERERCFILRDTFLLSRKDKKTGEWLPPSEEEWNLLYVAITRAKNELVYVEGARNMQRRGE